MKLIFRPLEHSDFTMLQIWLSAPHVKSWWNTALSLDEVEAKYGPRVDGTEPTQVYVIELEGQPIGFIQTYRWADYPDHARQLGAANSASGIDLAIGAPDMTGKGLGPRVIDEFIRNFIFIDADVAAIITDVQDENLRSRRAFEKAGFVSTAKIKLRGEEVHRHVMRLDRPLRAG